MAYVINKTDGTTITTITDGTVDNTTSLQLFGKSYSGFGEGLNENLVKLLENAASTSAPTAPLKGELWFDTTTNQIKVYDGTSFKPTGGAKAQASQPSNPSAGDLWNDTDTDQFYFYSGSAWILVGPVYNKTQTLSGWSIESINDDAGSGQVIASMYVGNTRVAIMSKQTFTPAAAITGFATIQAGFSLNSTLSAEYTGGSPTASLDVSSTTNTSASVIAGGNFLRADAADTTTGALTIDSDSGIIIGDEQELSITASTGDITIAQTRQDKDLAITVDDGGVTKTPIKIDSSNAYVGIWTTSPTVPFEITGDVKITGNLEISGEYNASSSAINTYDDAFIKLNNGNSETDSGVIVETSDTDDARMFYDVSENYWAAGENQSYSQVIRLADATTDGDSNKEKVLKTDSNGRLTATFFTMPAVGSISTSDTTDTDVPTTGAVVSLINSEQPKWGSSQKTVSETEPTSGDGNDGDFWFVREA
jgi:hypothetical protein